MLLSNNGMIEMMQSALPILFLNFLFTSFEYWLAFKTLFNVELFEQNPEVKVNEVPL